ncbi:hypothetical protein [Halorubrum sp. CSM-61]|uniref:hypothetical protein n=1 Tax=Halorubrum sp. CSM-61 TaxID=2485838 RepID=UPI001F14B94B|nr:hypothetical protein [Halorubrum sp. CSM-61]
MYRGTDADHAKAEWFAELWKEAVDGRDEKEIHPRGVHYYVTMNDLDVEPPTDCSWAIYQNTQRCYDYLEEASVLARILGYVPLDGVRDDKHDQTIVTRYGGHQDTVDPAEVSIPMGVSTPAIPDPDAEAMLDFDAETDDFAEYVADRIVDDLASQIRFDRQKQSPYHVELWCEKTLPGYIHTLAKDLGVNVVVEGEGDLSLTIAHQFVQRVNEADKPAVVLYLSDHDPKGDDMAANMSSKLSWLDIRGNLAHRVVVEQLAVTPEQIRELGLPRKPIEESRHTGTGGRAYDTLVSDWEQRKGTGACELNALEQKAEDFKRIVRDGVTPYVDRELPERNREAIQQWKNDAHDAIVAAIDEAGVEDNLDELRVWLDRFNEEYTAAAEAFESLRKLKNQSEFRSWLRETSQAVEETCFPEVSAPEGQGSLPEDPLFDTDRDYVENVARIDRHREGQ